MRATFVIGALALGGPGAVACLVSVDESLADRPPIEDAGADADGSATTDATPKDDRACVGFTLGNYCGRSLPRYSGNAQDLVRCLDDGGVGEVTPCTAGCAVMPTGRRDVCDPCAGKADGSYCVHHLVSGYNASDVRITCSRGTLVTGGASAPKICPRGCSNAANFGDCL